MRRELDEELIVDGPWTARLSGVLNDDENAVGQVHFGLVHIVDVPSGRVAVRRADLGHGRRWERWRDQWGHWSAH